jgi:hypothetical protein
VPCEVQPLACGRSRELIQFPCNFPAISLHAPAPLAMPESEHRARAVGMSEVAARCEDFDEPGYACAGDKKN